MSAGTEMATQVAATEAPESGEKMIAKDGPKRELRIFPLFGVERGKCGCSDPTCSRIGKHPMVRWGEYDGNERGPDRGYGIPTGSANGIFVIDVDVRPDKDGSVAFDALGPCPDTLIVSTPSGGFHLYFALPEGLYVRNSAGKLAPGIDVRGEGGFVVGPGSRHKNGGTYEVLNDVAMVEPPAWLIEALAVPSTTGNPDGTDAPFVTPAVGEARERGLRRAIDYAKACGQCIEGSGAQNWIWSVALYLAATCKLGPDDAWEIFDAHFNPLCFASDGVTPYPWSGGDFERTFANATRSDVAKRDAANAAQAERFLNRVAGGQTSGTTSPASEGPVQITLGPDIARVVGEAIGALGRDAEIFQRGGRLVTVAYEPDSADDATDGRGAPRIVQLNAAQALVSLTRANVATWTKPSPKGYSNVRPTDDVVQGVLSAPTFPGIRRLVAIVETPLLRPDGTILQSPGYDPATACLYAPTCEFPEIPERPSLADAVAALSALYEVHRDFPHVDEASRHVAIAETLTLLGRTYIGAESTPAFGYSAVVQGSGKTLASETAGLICFGREPALVTFPTSDEELEKFLCSQARNASPLIAFDNVKTTFGGPSLEKVLTTKDKVEFRLLGKSETVSLPWRATISATGNALACTSDVGRRILLAKLDPNVENPEERRPENFVHYPLKPWILAERPRLVCAALTLLRAHACAGWPRAGVVPWASFEPWTTKIASAIAWAGGPNVLHARPTGEATNPELEELRGLAETWPRDADGKPIALNVHRLLASAKLTADGAPPSLPGVAPPSPRYPGLADALSAFAPPERFGDHAKALGLLLKKREGRVVGGMKLAGRRDSHTKTNVWTFVPA